ncbi:hypothetical protein Barb7_02363 [Bacteroidales bacterium Barb7]|nr:hypothetical protein Barb7_02363 [Bacteroidales bacterium Barb7]
MTPLITAAKPPYCFSKADGIGAFCPHVRLTVLYVHTSFRRLPSRAPPMK